MSKFKIGSYVVLVTYPYVMYKVTKIIDRSRVMVKEDNYSDFCMPTFMVRQATNNDYINTLTPNQKANFFYDVAHGKTQINWYDYPNRVHIGWLNSAYDGWVVK